MIKSGLAPVLDSNTIILILGSLPSDLSLQRKQYYANPGNDFWKLMSDLLDTDLVSREYEDRIRTLLDNKIGLWDVYAGADRSGSLDSAINNGIINDFSLLKKIAPGLRLICFNGKKAGEKTRILADLGYETLILPSSSGANRKNAAERRRRWFTLRALVRCS